jgi:CHRD domain-containing protein
MSIRKLVLIALTVVLAVTGAVTFAGATGDDDRLIARLTGAEEVPGPGDDDGSGRAVIELGEDEVCFTVRWKNIASPTAAHIHVGEAGVAGDIVVGLFMGTTPLPETISRVGGCVAADPAVIDAIEDNPSGYYVNVHNADFPGGAIRGQLESESDDDHDEDDDSDDDD